MEKNELIKKSQKFQIALRKLVKDYDVYDEFFFMARYKQREESCTFSESSRPFLKEVYYNVKEFLRGDVKSLITTNDDIIVEYEE